MLRILKLCSIKISTLLIRSIIYKYLNDTLIESYYTTIIHAENLALKDSLS